MATPNKLLQFPCHFRRESPPDGELLSAFSAIVSPLPAKSGRNGKLVKLGQFKRMAHVASTRSVCSLNPVDTVTFSVADQTASSGHPATPGVGMTRDCSAEKVRGAA